LSNITNGSWQADPRRQYVAQPASQVPVFTEAPIINTLIALETGHAVDPSTVARDRALAAEVLRFSASAESSCGGRGWA